MAVSYTATHRSQHARGGQNTEYKINTNTKWHTTQSLIEITTQRFGNWFCFRHQVETSEGDLFSGRYWRKSAIKIARNTKLISENMKKITIIKCRGNLTKW
jgi:hypothetical protein